jgi:cytidylate kinase
MIIAIDGPAAAGKSTVARAVAQALELELLDTGAMYRAVAREALAQGIDPSDAEGCARVARSIRIAFDPQGKILVDGRPGEPAIRSEAVTRAVSAVSSHSGVRAAIVPLQRARALGDRGIVAEGRDIGSVVFPDADFKFFLTASPEVRAQRRAAEMGSPGRLAEIQDEIRRRDRLDSTREDSPLVQASDAMRIDTDDLDARGVAEAILAVVRGDPQKGREAALRNPTASRATLFYRLLYLLDRTFCRLWFRLKIEGLENIPRDSGALLAANHQSYLDILVVGASIPRHVTFVARDTLAEWWWLAFTMRQCGAILIQRGTSDRAALRAMAAHLSAGDLVAIYPEGTRTRDGRPGSFKGGAVMAARLAGVPIVPVGIRGGFQAWPRGRIIPWPKRIGVRFGTPIDPRVENARERLEEAVRGMIGDGSFASVPPAP